MDLKHNQGLGILNHVSQFRSIMRNIMKRSKFSWWMAAVLSCLALVSLVLGSLFSGPGLSAAAPEDVKVGLEVGNRAPEIQGEDLDGVKFKLSDYRGKVVMLDFWGDW
jgi:cytochrome oxidase Cu insertion factor (SCO1/SenC/PrrC family)